MARIEEENGTTQENADREMGKVRISVRNLVEFILRCGDIDNRHQRSQESAMQEGNRIHRKLQKRMGADYRSEVFLRYIHQTKEYQLIIEGRADGIWKRQEEVMVDEIKGTYRELSRMREPVPVHVAQAKCYAYMYAAQEQLAAIRVRMTYCNIETEDIRYFYEDYTFAELEEWFGELLRAYQKWADYAWEWKKIRQASIEALSFPFPYREGQKELISYVYQTIYHKRKLFLEAPTGVGKTIATLFPAIKAMGRGMGEKLFYLTAKTITGAVAEDTIVLLRQKGLHFKSVVLTAKEKICFLEKPECNPEKCPYAKGHFDRINEAIYALMTSQEHFTREKITEYAKQHQVCPFEMGLDMSLFADGIICDYNYLFDPHVYLRRFFGEGSEKQYLFLVDEAHNLLERGREMYSASLYKEDFTRLKRELKKAVMLDRELHRQKSEIAGQMSLDIVEMSQETAVAETTPKRGRGKTQEGSTLLVREGYGERMLQQLEYCNKELLVRKRECEEYCQVEELDTLVHRLMRLYATMGEYLEKQEKEALPVREQLLDFYFTVGHFLDIYERMDENYVKYTQLGEDNTFLLKLFCVNPKKDLRECMARGRSTILFSATFLPIQYYKGLLGGEKEDYEVYAKSVFETGKRALLIAADVTSRYTRRSEAEYQTIARYIAEIVKNRRGNYMVFCPSYSFLHTVYEIYLERFATEETECVLQQESMTEADREEFLGRFQREETTCAVEGGEGGRKQEKNRLIGFCVLGGIFGEGIDLKKDSLIGVIVVGTGIPQVCVERELLKEYFNRNGENGFDYSYRYPGMNKVLQAAGRVIRTVEDVGIIALLDERFLQYAYRRLFPREWQEFAVVGVDTVAGQVEAFWKKWQ